MGINTEFEFYKYSSHGNQFLLIDETQKEITSEDEKPILSEYLYNKISPCPVLYLQNYNADVVKRIYTRYKDRWSNGTLNNLISDTKKKDSIDHFILRKFCKRSFEEDDYESSFCISGSFVAAYFLKEIYDLRQSSILTQIPTTEPKIRKVSTTSGNGLMIEMENPIDIPDLFLPPDEKKSCQLFQKKKNIRIINEKFNELPIVEVFGFLSFLGEPNLVIFVGHNCQNKNISIGEFDIHSRHIYEHFYDDLLFDENKRSFHISKIGDAMNKQTSRYPFYKGININIAEISEEHSSLKLRTYERISNRELNSCGVGAIVSCYLANSLGLIKKSTEITVYTKNCISEPSKCLLIKKKRHFWSLSGTAERLSNCKAIWRKQ